MDRLNDLQREIQMTPIRETLDQNEREVTGLADTLKSIRSRGYVQYCLVSGVEASAGAA